MGDTGGREGVECGWDTDSSQINRPQKGDGGTIGGSTYNLNHLYTVSEVQSREAVENTLVTTRVTK